MTSKTKKYILENYKIKSRPQMAAELGTTYYFINLNMKKLGIGDYKFRNADYLDAKQMLIVRENCKTYTIPELCVMIFGKVTKQYRMAIYGYIDRNNLEYKPLRRRFRKDYAPKIADDYTPKERRYWPAVYSNPDYSRLYID